jgi:hypothetical protein
VGGGLVGGRGGHVRLSSVGRRQRLADSPCIGRAGLKTAKEIATGTALTAAVGGVVGGAHKALGSPLGATHGAAIGAAIGLAGGIKNARKDYKYNRMFHEEDQALFSETELAYLESKLAEIDNK